MISANGLSMSDEMLIIISIVAIVCIALVLNYSAIFRNKRQYK